MKKVLIINAHQTHEFSAGKLNMELVNRMAQQLKAQEYEVKTSSVEDYDIEHEVNKHVWADIVIIQSPVYWMALPWLAKKYIDEVYMAGVFDGRLCKDDGRTTAEPKKNYGTGGTLNDKKYMFSLTFNAPQEAFDNSTEYLFQGKGVDDLFFWLHCSFRFLAMKSLPTFVCYDVIKNAEIENDFERLENHIEQYVLERELEVV